MIQESQDKHNVISTTVTSNHSKSET